MRALILFGCILIILLGFVPPATAQEKEKRPFHYGASFVFAATAGDLDDVSNYGLGVHFAVEKELTDIISAVGNVGWTTFIGQDDFDNLDGFTIEAGAKLRLTYFFGEARIGYYGGDIDHFTVTPAVGVHLRKQDISIG